MSDITNIRRHLYGAFYWLPTPAGLLAIFYSGMCFEGYWDYGRIAFLIFAIFAASLGITLVTVGIRSYAVAAIEACFAILIVVLVIHTGQWLFLYLAFMSAVFSITAGFVRNRDSHTQTQ